MTVIPRGTEAPVAPIDAEDGLDSRRGVRIALALAVGALALLPVWRLLDRPDTGLAGAATVAMTETTVGLVWSGLALLCIPALLAARALPDGTVDRFARAVSRILLAPRPVVFAAFAALLAFAASAAFARFALDGQPNLVDAMSQLLQARFVAAGSLSGPGSAFGAFWMPQQSLFTPEGWVSQYPPGHVFLLALGMKAGAVWAVGPALLGTAVFFTGLAAGRLLGERPAVARLGALLAAISPFLIAQSGAFMNHASAAAFAAIAVWCAARASSGSAVWPVAAGAAAGAMFTTRPLSALTLAAVISLWLLMVRSDARPLGRRALSVAGMAAGALPFGLLIAAYNTHFFGSPTRFGYEAALGPAGGLGFGVDPWGNSYGVVEALAYTSAELASLSQYLLETTLPLAALIALWLALKPRLAAGEALVAGWALAPLAVQLLYWHHGLFMGPRMLAESAPAWCLLAAIAVTWLIGALPERTTRLGPYSPRAFAATAAVFAVVSAAAALAPMRLASHAQRPRAPAVALAAPAPALVFVHGGWTSRLSARLAAGGMRLDSVETALRQNPTCAVQSWADARDSGAALPTLDFERRASNLPQTVEISPGNRIRVGRDERPGVECGRQAAADRLGTIDVTPLLWLGAVPGSEGPITFARDLGPEWNARLIAESGGRSVWVLATPSPDAPPQLIEYETAMRALWGEEGI